MRRRRLRVRLLDAAMLGLVCVGACGMIATLIVGDIPIQWWGYLALTGSFLVGTAVGAILFVRRG